MVFIKFTFKTSIISTAFKLLFDPYFLSTFLFTTINVIYRYLFTINNMSPILFYELIVICSLN